MNNNNSKPDDGNDHALAQISEPLRGQIRRVPLDWCRRILVRTVLKREPIPEDALTPINYAWRPQGYFDPQNPLQLIANIQGVERKKDARRLLEQGRLDEAYEFILIDQPDPEFRKFLGKLHPALMGGEYLPDYHPGEIEIARVAYDSVTNDVASIRARPGPGDQPILYRIVDDWSECEEYSLQRDFSEHPLTLQELIHLIDTASGDDKVQPVLGLLNIKFECSDDPISELASFIEVSSEFYPDLAKHYWFALQEWAFDKWELPQSPERQQQERELRETRGRV
jgi:hypothetical protein